MSRYEYEELIENPHTNDGMRGIVIDADARNPQKGNASHHYRISYGVGPKDEGHYEEHYIDFQDGPVAENDINGVTNEILIAILLDRLAGFQSSKWACQSNADAATLLGLALQHLQSRTKLRQAQGIEGTSAVGTESAPPTVQAVYRGTIGKSWADVNRDPEAQWLCH